MALIATVCKKSIWVTCEQARLCEARIRCCILSVHAMPRVFVQPLNGPSEQWTEWYMRVKMFRSLMLYGLRGVRGCPTLCCDSLMAVQALSKSQQSLLR